MSVRGFQAFVEVFCTAQIQLEAMSADVHMDTKLMQLLALISMNAPIKESVRRILYVEILPATILVIVILVIRAIFVQILMSAPLSIVVMLTLLARTVMEATTASVESVTAATGKLVIKAGMVTLVVYLILVND